ncbi:MAG TPA: DUF4249 domain-containing protein [Bacteroidales bacterium]|nr:DUF4249 domain-containing protein [Bacteroidales bacterium]
MRYSSAYKIAIMLLLLSGCVEKFNPDIKENKNLLVVEGMVTDQPESYKIKLSISQPVTGATTKTVLSGATVSVSDNDGNSYPFTEYRPGEYRSDSTRFRGEIGKKYSLHVNTSSTIIGDFNFQSYPVELKEVPLIDSVYYERVVTGIDQYNNQVEGCQIYLDTHDDSGKCNYYRWTYSETWEFHLRWDLPNSVCWRTENSYDINLKNTADLAENRINRFPLHFVDNSTDRLGVEYSILVSQYSVSEDEFNFWTKVKNVTQDVGGLYDVIPASINGNITCVEDPSRQVLGYFSVSGKATKRIFTKGLFSGQKNFYTNCISDTIKNHNPIQGVGEYVWILYVHDLGPYYVLITNNKSCADCTTRGTNVKPDFWVTTY